MPNAFSIREMGDALNRRLYPTVTVWNRLEGRPRSQDFERALRAEVRDPLFMLTRQLQLGEFTGTDSGSPVLARVRVDVGPINFGVGPSAVPFAEEVPLEARVERRAVPFVSAGRKVALDLRLVMGRYWLKLISDIGDYRKEFAAKYPILPPDSSGDVWRFAHPEVNQAYAAVAGRMMDGADLYRYLEQDRTHQACDGVEIGEAQRNSVNARGQEYVDWFRRLIYQPAVGENEAWTPERLEYAFSCSAPSTAGEKVFRAEGYHQGALDWYSLDGEHTSPGHSPTTGITRTVIPAPLTFEGMPNPRWWEFEDRKTNLGAVDVNTTELGKLLLLEFGLVYSDDWFIVPCTLPVGCVATISGIAVTNTFGERFWILPAGAGPDDGWQKWGMFTISTKGELGKRGDPAMLLLPVAPGIQESRALEEVVLIRDEVSNTVWGIEKTVLLATGAAKPGSEAAAETMQLLSKAIARKPASVAEPKPAIRYTLMNTIPENWIPFIPVHVGNNNRSIQLQRAALPRAVASIANTYEKVEPRTTLLRVGLDRVQPEPYFVHEEEVPRSGVRLTQKFRRARWRNGRVVLWLAAERQTGRGEGSSGLAFDRIIDVRETEGQGSPR